MVLIRRAAVEDALQVARFVDALLMELSGAASKFEARLATAKHLLTLQDRIFGFLALQQQPIGVMMMSESASIYAGGMFGVITELYVASEQRSTGVARMLINAGAALGRQRRWSRMEVGAPHQPAWQRSLKFYLRSGFVEVGPRLQLML
jgi:GNAT superfamily N-acetyltransferase